MAEADYLIDIGPEAGSEGGTIVAQGTPEQVAKSRQSRTAPFLARVLGKFVCGDANSAQFYRAKPATMTCRILMTTAAFSL